MKLGRELERIFARIIAKSPPPAETGTAWTEREVQRGIAFRRRPDGEVVTFAICADCKNGFMAKLYHGKFRQLCRDCWFLSPDAYSKKDDEDQERVLRNMGGGEWVIAMLARSCKLTKAACEQALINLAAAGKVERRGRAWARVDVGRT